MNPQSEGRRELDSVVINIELTLASIIQGVALFFLTDNARAIITMRHWGSFLYVAAGLCVIFIFWSRSIIHTLTLIRWPMEFGHNFFYIGCALGEAILFSRLDNPLAWFQLSATYAAAVWLLFTMTCDSFTPASQKRLTKPIGLFTGEPEPINCSIFICWFLCFFSSTSLVRSPFGSGLISSLLAVATSG